MSGPRKSQSSQKRTENDMNFVDQKSQIINFERRTMNPSNLSGIARRSPGALVRVRLLNVLETFSNAPVHVQIVDAGLGRNLIGGTIIGDATADQIFNRINIMFQFVRDPKREGFAIPILARALSLDGTLGVNAKKKEGFFSRASLNSAGATAQETEGKTEGSDLKHILIKALTTGLIQEYGSDSRVEQNKSQVLTLQPNTEFFIELTDYFPATNR